MVKRSGGETGSTVTTDGPGGESLDGVFEYDQENGQVALGEMSDRLAKYTRLAMDDENVSVEWRTL